MIQDILTQDALKVNDIISDLTILVIRAFDKKGDWMIEVVFEDGIKATRSSTAEEANAIEGRLADLGLAEPTL